MSQLSFKEFLKLSEKEKCERYEELSEHHKFLARISQNVGTEEFKEREKNFNAMLEEARKKRKNSKK